MNRVNALSIDVEDYFQVANLEHVIDRKDWDKYECRIEKNTLKILEILDGYKVKATFFVLGWIAERYPGLVKKIHQEGHEIASHGYGHQPISDQTKMGFREDIRISRQILEDIIAERIIGYRAPMYSITQNSMWIFKVLIEEGFKYDSSVFPVRYYRYGTPNTPRFPYVITLDGQTGSTDLTGSTNSTDSFIIEFPITTLGVLGENLPIAGGGYFRLFPYEFTKWGLKKINRKEGKPFIFYIHPWEFDVNQPRIKGVSNLAKFRHYINLDKTEDKLRRLLTDFNFSSVKDVLGIQPAIK